MSALRLSQIWAASPEELRRVLITQGYDLTDNPNQDRALVAMIYYNDNKLSKYDDASVWVSHPRFMEVMASIPPGMEELKAGLQILKTSFVIRVLILYGAIDNALFISERLGKTFGNADVWVESGNGAGFDARVPIVSAAHSCSSNATVKAVRTAFGKITGVSASIKARKESGKILDAEPKVLGRTIAMAVWQTIISLDARTGAAVATVRIEQENFNPATVMEKLLNVDLESMIQMARCFWIYSIWELLNDMPPSETLNKKFTEIVTKSGCTNIFAEVPVAIATGLSPVLDQMGGAGRAAMMSIIEEYAARPPTREEVMQRLLTLP